MHNANLHFTDIKLFWLGAASSALWNFQRALVRVFPVWKAWGLLISCLWNIFCASKYKKVVEYGLLLFVELPDFLERLLCRAAKTDWICGCESCVVLRSCWNFCSIITFFRPNITFFAVSQKLSVRFFYQTWHVVLYSYGAFPVVLLGGWKLSLNNRVFGHVWQFLDFYSIFSKTAVQFGWNSYHRMISLIRNV